jgi:hypothetical protein
MSILPLSRTQRVLTEEGKRAMKYKTLFTLRLLLGLVVLAIGNGQTGGLGLVFQQIEAIGPRQWLNLMAGTIAPNALVSERIARRFSSQPIPIAGDEIAGDTSV